MSMSGKNYINIFKKLAKWIVFFLIGIVLLIFVSNWILNLRGRGFANKTTFGNTLKPDTDKKLLKAKLKTKTGADIYDSKNNLKDIFDIPYKKYKRFNRLFISSRHVSGGAGNSFNSGQPVGSNLSNFITKLKFKGFSKKTRAYPSLIFISGKIALLKIDGRSYYVHTGESVRGIFILKIGLSGVSYSDGGKIKYLNF